MRNISVPEVEAELLGIALSQGKDDKQALSFVSTAMNAFIRTYDKYIYDEPLPEAKVPYVRMIEVGAILKYLEENDQEQIKKEGVRARMIGPIYGVALYQVFQKLAQVS